LPEVVRQVMMVAAVAVLAVYNIFLMQHYYQEEL
jgi:hypothetical protein